MSAATLLCSDDLRKHYQPRNTGEPQKSLIDGVYSTRKGQCAIECCDVKTAERLANALYIKTGVGEESFQQHLRDVLLTKTANEWIEVLEQADIPASVVVEDLTDLQTIPHLQPGLITGSYTKVISPWRFK
jgi:crotonobetainyl-CoA:carnitine CoA-transferase CaiB-like acyl-CoA transferase